MLSTVIVPAVASILISRTRSGASLLGTPVVRLYPTGLMSKLYETRGIESILDEFDVFLVIE